MWKLQHNARKRSTSSGPLRRSGIVARLCPVALLFAIFCSTVGCQSFKDLNRSFWNSPEAPKPPEHVDNHNTPPEKNKPQTAAENPSNSQAAITTPTQNTQNNPTGNLFTKEESPFRIDDVEAILAKKGGWIGTPTPKRDKVPWNWYHPQIEEILAWPKENDRAIRISLKKKNPISATNAAICLARLGDASGVSILLGAIRSPRLDMPLRAAAAEAFASLDSSTQTVQKLIDEYGDGGKAPSPTLYRELIRGLARHVDPAGDARFIKALQSKDAHVRHAAIEAWQKSQGTILPNELIYLASDQSERNRAAVMHALGTHDHPERMRYLDSGLKDMNYLVRVAAVESLGKIGSPTAVQRLQDARKSNSTIVRAAAARSLAQAGQFETALPLAKDESWQVRLAVAEVLPKNPSDRTLQIAGNLLHDRSIQVQQQTLEAIKTWPVAQSGPLLLDAIEHLSFQMRQDAITQLATLWEPAKNFPRHAPDDVRKRAILQFRAEFQKAFGITVANPTTLVDYNPSQPVAIDPELVSRAKRLIAKHNDPRCASADRYHLRQQIRNGLGPHPLAVLEYLVFEEHQDLPEEFYTTILPELDPTFDLLYQMQIEAKPSVRNAQQKTLLTRRRAASKLIRMTADQKPSRLALDRLAEQMLQESDSLVWRSVLIALADNDGESMLQMVRIAIGHESAEIRRRACEWLAAHPSPDHFPLLKPVLSDPETAVKVAAVRAIVASGKLSDTESLQNMLDGNQNTDALAARLAQGNAAMPGNLNLKEIAPLKKLLGESNEELRTEVAYALAAFGDENGAQALKQLAQSRDANVRQKTAEMIGRLEDPRYTPLLINLLDDHLNVRRAALNALPKTVGHEVPAAGDRKPQTTAEIVARWKEWYANRNRTMIR
ncbi:MAG: HEAT repeat domain-containing protein [Planctomycetia bacterium]